MLYQIIKRKTYIVITSINNERFWIGKAARIIFDQEYLEKDLQKIELSAINNPQYEYNLIINC